ncbi:unnamed protein product [Calypogeia fissa]
MWSCCSMSSRNAVAKSGASTSSLSPSSVSAAAPHTRPSLRSPSFATQQPLFGSRRQSVHHFTRLPGEIGSISSLMPRHNATAAARLVSKLSGDLTPQIEGSLARYVSPI